MHCGILLIRRLPVARWQEKCQACAGRQNSLKSAAYGPSGQENDQKASIAFLAERTKQPMRNEPTHGHLSRELSAPGARRIGVLCFSAVFAGASFGQAHKGACERRALAASPTNLSKTFIRKGFGEFDAPRKGGESTHKGVDITRSTSDRDPAATAVFSVASGKVAYARVNGSETDGYGNVVVVDHLNGCYSMYAHLANKPFTPAKPGANLEVKVGDEVSNGALIGYFVDIKSDTTSTGNAVQTDPLAREQVHFQLIEAPPGRGGSIGKIIGSDGRVIDPTPLLLGLGYAIR